MEKEDLFGGRDISKQSEAFKKRVDKIWNDINNLTLEEQEKYLAEISKTADEELDKRETEEENGTITINPN